MLCAIWAKHLQRRWYNEVVVLNTVDGENLAENAGESDEGTADSVADALEARGFESIDDFREARESGKFAEEHGVFEYDADPTGSRRRLVLLGAGASSEAGLPIATEFDRLLRENIDLPLYRSLSPLLGHDFEVVVQIMEFLADSGTGNLLGKFGAWGYFENLAGISPNTSSDHSRRELQVVRDVIRSTFWIGPEREQRCAYLSSLINAQQGGTIATLNYDNTLQILPEGGVFTHGVASDGSVNSPVVFPYWVQCLPLHGYLGWEERRDPYHDVTNVVPADEHQDPANLDYPYNPAIIFGSGNKLRHFGPFLGLLHDFTVALGECETVITIGYSWRDPHINRHLRQWASERANEIAMLRPIDRSEKRKRLVVCTGPNSGVLPEPAEILRTHFNASVQVVPIKGTATKVIAELFGEGGQFSDRHFGSYKRFVCGL